MILVTGATGKVGSQLVKLLDTAGYEVRAMARSPEKAQAIAGANVEVVKGDFTDRASIDRAMHGADHVFLLSLSGPDQLANETNVAESAANAGVSHLVKLSVLGASPFTPVRLGRWHWESEKMIERLGLPFSFIRPPTFFENMLLHADSIAAEDKFYLPAGKGKMSSIAVLDIAEVAMKVLTDVGHLNREYDITGPEPVSYYDIASALSKALGREVTYVEVPDEAVREGMKSMGFPDWLIGDMSAYMGYMREGYELPTTPWVARITGRAPTSIEDWAKAHVAAFMG